MYKNCEEYVLKRLECVEGELNESEKTVISLREALKNAQARIERLERLIGTRTSTSTYVTNSGLNTLSFDEPWPDSESEADDFALMKELMEKYNIEKEE